MSQRIVPKSLYSHTSTALIPNPLHIRGSSDGSLMLTTPLKHPIFTIFTEVNLISLVLHPHPHTPLFDRCQLFEYLWYSHNGSIEMN
jgi:hypothetical protein